MPAVKLTAHAERRSNQRGIRRVVIDILLEFGASTINGRGCEVVYMDKESRRRARRALGKGYAKLERALDAYLVVSPDGGLVTCGHRLEKIHS